MNNTSTPDYNAPAYIVHSIHRNEDNVATCIDAYNGDDKIINYTRSYGINAGNIKFTAKYDNSGRMILSNEIFANGNTSKRIYMYSEDGLVEYNYIMSDYNNNRTEYFQESSYPANTKGVPSKCWTATFCKGVLVCVYLNESDEHGNQTLHMQYFLTVEEQQTIKEHYDDYVGQLLKSGAVEDLFNMYSDKCKNTLRYEYTYDDNSHIVERKLFQTDENGVDSLYDIMTFEYEDVPFGFNKTAHRKCYSPEIDSRTLYSEKYIEANDFDFAKYDIPKDGIKYLFIKEVFSYEETENSLYIYAYDEIENEVYYYFRYIEDDIETEPGIFIDEPLCVTRTKYTYNGKLETLRETSNTFFDINGDTPLEIESNTSKRIFTYDNKDRISGMVEFFNDEIISTSLYEYKDSFHKEAQ